MDVSAERKLGCPNIDLPNLSRKWFHYCDRVPLIDIDSSPAGRAIRKAYDRALYSVGYNRRHDSAMLVMGTGLMAYPVPVAVAALE